MPRARRRNPDGSVERRGGPREGQPGGQYPNRSDLRTQKVQSAPGQVYGARKAQEDAQRAVPMAAAPPVPQGLPQGAQGGFGPGFVPPDQTPTLGGPSSRPDEPLTAGLPFGPGRTPGPMDRAPSGASDDVVDRLRALYMLHPTPELAELIDQTWV